MCRSGCPTQDHASYGECCRAARLQIDKHGLQHRDLERRKDSDVEFYRSARRQGIQPDGVARRDVQRALDLSDRMGAPYQSRM